MGSIALSLRQEAVLKEIVRPREVLLFHEGKPLKLECGEELKEVKVVYETYGQLNEERDNAVLLVHSLTMDAHAAGYHNLQERKPGWWDEVIGGGRGIDTRKYFVISSNLLGSCYGTTGPAGINPETGKRYGGDFPPITTRDMGRVLMELVDFLGIEKLVAVIGGSLGGMIVWQLGVDYPERMAKLIPIAGSPRASAWLIGFNEVARQAILNHDEDERNRLVKGLKLARMIAMLTYRSEISLDFKFGLSRSVDDLKRYFDRNNPYQVQNYLHYQGEELVRRFDPDCYLTLTSAMDYHDISRGYGDMEKALRRIQAEIFPIGIDTDRLFPAAHLRQITTLLSSLGKQASYHEISSIHGHDAFLIESEQLNRIFQMILED